jgi:hypothetical protein
MIIVLLILIIFVILFPGVFRAIFGLALLAVIYCSFFPSSNSTETTSAVSAASDPTPIRKGGAAAWAWHDKADAAAQAGCWSIADPVSRSDCYRRNGHAPIAETSASDDISITRQEVIDFAASRGQSERELAAEIGDTIPNIEAFAYAAEHTGSSANEALTGLLNFSKASRDPEKVQLLMCLGVKPARRSLTPQQCDATARQLGFPPPFPSWAVH